MGAAPLLRGRPSLPSRHLGTFLHLLGHYVGQLHGRWEADAVFVGHEGDSNMEFAISCWVSSSIHHFPLTDSRQCVLKHVSRANSMSKFGSHCFRPGFYASSL